MVQFAQNEEQVASMNEQNVAVVVGAESLGHDPTQAVNRMRESVQQFTV